MNFKIFVNNFLIFILKFNILIGQKLVKTNGRKIGQIYFPPLFSGHEFSTTFMVRKLPTTFIGKKVSTTRVVRNFQPLLVVKNF